MRPTISCISLLLATALTLPALTSSARAQLTLPEERGASFPLPDLALPSAEDGRLVSLSELAGEKYILHVFASW